MNKINDMLGGFKLLNDYIEIVLIVSYLARYVK